MQDNDFIETVVWRTGSSSRNDPKRNELIMQSVKTLKQVYFVERRSISVHIPPEDEHLQRKYGGSKASPVLIGLFTPKSLPLQIPKDLSLNIFRRLSDFVVPFFTSEARALNFVDTIKDKGCIVPDHKLMHINIDPKLAHWIDQGNGVVNPIPEFVLTAFIAMEFDPDGDGRVKMITVIAPDPDIDQENENTIDGFFNKR